VGTLDGKDPAQTDIHCYLCSDAVGGGLLVWHLWRLGFHLDAFRKTEMVPPQPWVEVKSCHPSYLLAPH
jgi:hypothetical protein